MCHTRKITSREVAIEVAGSPTVRRWELGTRLRELRHGAGLTVEQVADKLLCSPAKVSRIETGHRGASLRDVRDLCNLYRVNDETRERLMALARDARQPAWWQKYDVQDALAKYIGLEAEATVIRCFEVSLVPGLLQTSAYATTVFQDSLFAFGPEEVQKRLDVRMARQALLTREDPPTLHFVLDESVLRRSVGGVEVMRHQLTRVLEAARLPHLTVQVIPFAAGLYAGMVGSFTIFAFPQQMLPDVVFFEHVFGAQYLERQAEVALYTSAFEQNCARAASPEDSVALITEVMRDLAG
jgi:transcriptional regulator with XRE-family HTH domain